MSKIFKREPAPGELTHAVTRGELKSVQDLLQRGANVNESDEKGIAPLLMAAHCSRLEIAQLLLDSGADVNVRIAEGTPLIAVARVGLGKATEVMRLLIERGASLDASDEKGQTALDIARENNFLGLVRVLEEAAENQAAAADAAEQEKMKKARAATAHRQKILRQRSHKVSIAS